MRSMGRGGNDFKRHWRDKHLDLPDGDRLTWMVVDRPDGGSFIAYFRLNDEGVHSSIGRRILAEHGHPDAEVPAVGEESSRPPTGPPPLDG